MANYELGKVLRMAREAKGMTQDQFVELYSVEEIKSKNADDKKGRKAKKEDERVEICSTQALRRIENGTVKRIKLKVLYQLMEKAGMLPEQMHPSILATKPLALNLKAEIHVLIQQKEYEKAEKELQKLEEMIVPGYPRNRQYLLHTNAKLAIARKEITKEEYLKILLDALSATVPALDQVDIAGWPLDWNEFLILFDMLDVYHSMKEREKELELLLKLKENVETHYMDPIYYTVWHSRILVQLSQLACIKQQYEESLEYCKTGIEECRRYRILGDIHYFLYDMVWCKEQQMREKLIPKEMGLEEQEISIKKEREFCKKQLVQAYCICMAQGVFYSAKRIRKLGEELYPDEIKWNG